MSAPSPDIAVRLCGYLGFELANELKTILATPANMSDQLYKKIQQFSGGDGINVQGFITTSGSTAIKSPVLLALSDSFGRDNALAIANYYA